MLFGSADQEAQSEHQLASLAQEMYNANLLYLLVRNLAKIDFEVRQLRGEASVASTSRDISPMSDWNVDMDIDAEMGDQVDSEQG